MARMSSDTLYIDSPEELTQLASTLSSQRWIALDTEFLRERTYRPDLCLIQVATKDLVACIDPLALDSIDPLLDVIYNPDVTKVLHASGQDLEIFYWLRGKVPTNLFDTQIAAPLLGYQEQIGYGNLVSEVLKINLSKSHSRADWTRRPLPEKQLQYAADDVIHLAKMYPIMREWENLQNPENYEKPVDSVWMRIRGIDKLKGPRLSAAQQLAKWRELTAKERNMPRNWLIKDDVIVDLSKQMPANISELKHIRGLNDGIIKQHGTDLIDCITMSKSIDPVIPAQHTRKPKLKADQDAAIDLLTAVAKLHALELEINPSILAPRKSIDDLVRGKQDTLVMQGWRGQLIGPVLAKVLAGDTSLRIVNGVVTISEQSS